MLSNFIQEVDVKTGSFMPEYGRATGGIINVVMKSGTNEYHGSAFDCLGNDKLNANNWARNWQNTPRTPVRLNTFGGTLGYLQKPHHGKTWTIKHSSHPLFEGVPNPCKVGAYHSIHGLAETLPAELEVLAANENGVIMALRHRDFDIEGVQFHPESILSEHGHAMLRNFLSMEVH